MHDRERSEMPLEAVHVLATDDGDEYYRVELDDDEIACHTCGEAMAGDSDWSVDCGRDDCPQMSD